MINFICVRTGTAYGIEYVQILRNMIARHCPIPFTLTCLTDQPDQVPGVTFVDVSALGLTGWWAKMAVFDPALRRAARPDCEQTGRTIYLDLDTVIVGDLTPLVLWGGEFGICENFTRKAGHPSWPCRYGSCVMSLAPGWGAQVYTEFMENRQEYMTRAGKYGDQHAIERIAPHAEYLQDELPAGFFVGRRAFTESQPVGASLMIFAGPHKPHNTKIKWLRETWK